MVATPANATIFPGTTTSTLGVTRENFEPELVAFLKSTYGVWSDAEVGGEVGALWDWRACE